MLSKTDDVFGVVIVFAFVLAAIIFVVVWITDHIRSFIAGRQNRSASTAPELPTKAIWDAVLGGALCAGLIYEVMLQLMKEAAASSAESGIQTTLSRWLGVLYSWHSYTTWFAVIIFGALLGLGFRYYINRIPTSD